MVRETRYLLVGNLPENTTENDITEYFKRFGRIQKVKIERKPEEKDDKDESTPSSTLTATVAFTDIKSASNAHKADKKLSNNTLTSEYSEGFGATGSVVTRTHEPDHFPRTSGFNQPNRKGFEEEADGFDVYYGTTSPFNESPYSGSSPFSDRGRPRERWPAGAAFPGRGGKWAPGATRAYPADGTSKDGFEKPKTSSSIPASSPTHSASQSSEKHGKKKKKSKSVDRSRSSSGSSRSSSSSSESASASSSKERPKSTVTAAQPPQRSDSQDSAPKKEGGDIEPGEREPLGIYITKLPLRSSDTSLRDGLFHEYKKYGKITAVQVSGVSETRFAIVSFKQSEDAAKALEASKEKRFFGTNIVVVPHEGIEVDDPEYGTPEQQLDEHSPKATRTLFLGNLEKDITIEELKEKLEKYGEILDVDVKRQGAISAYAFIQFTDITSVVRSLRDLDGTTWGPSKLKVGFGKSMATSVIWLDNLAETVTEGFLYRQFGRFGGISHTVVDRVKRKGLVFFLNIESAQYALPEMRNRIWNGKKIHIDFASRDCQENFYQKMEQSNQLRPGERPDQRWMQKQMQNEPFWDESVDAVNTARRGSFTQVGRGRGRFQRGRGVYRGRGGSFEIGFATSSSADEFAGRRRQVDEFSQGSGPFMEDDYEQELRDYGHSQRERRERSSQSPPGYEDIYYEAGSQTGRDYDLYEKHRYTSYRSVSPGSDRDMDTIDDEYRYKTRTPSDDRYYYKDKFYEESKSRDRSHSSDSETRFRLSSEIVRRSSRSRSPTLKHKRTKDLPMSYRSQSPPTPTDDEPSYYPESGSPTDFDSAYRKYDYKKRLSSSAEGDKKSDIFSRTGLRKEIEAKSEERTSRKRSYDQLSPSRSDVAMRLERQHSRGSKSGSVFDYNDKQSVKELISKVNRLKSEVHDRTFGKESPSSGSSYGDVDTSNMSEAELAKLHREKQKLLDKLTQLDDNGNNSDSENLDTRRVVSKKARLDAQSGSSKYLHKSDSLTKQEIKEKLKMLDSAQSSRKQLEALRKKELLRDIKKSKSSDAAKKDFLDYSDDEQLSLNSPHELSGYMPKKRRKTEGDSDRKSRSYRTRRDDEQGYSSDDEKDRRDLLQKQIGGHSDLFGKSRSGSMDVHLENDLLYSHSKDDSRRTSSGSDNNKESSSHSRRHRRKKDDHITPLIPLGDDDLPDPETSDPRTCREKMTSPMVLPLPEFAQFIQFSPLPSPHRSPEYSDLPVKGGQEKDSGSTGETGNPDQSPCFSPQSSSSKTHSPSQSPSGSGSDSKANTNSDSGELPPGFPTVTEQPDVGDEHKPDSLDSLPDPTKLPSEMKDDNDSLSDNNSDTENMSSENLSIEERIRRLDEKWSKAQAVVAATTHKIIPDVESVVNPSTSSVLSSLSVTPTTSMNLTVSSPNVSSLYSKYRIRKKNDQSSTADKAEPSEIVQTVLSKSSIFDQDSRRLGQYGDSYDSKDTVSNEESTSQLPSVWNKLDNNKDSPMVTVPGSLMDRLGQTQNMSFPTLTVNTSLTNSLSSQNISSNKHLDSLNSSGFNSTDNLLSKASPGILLNSNSASNMIDSNKPSIEQTNESFNSVTLNTPVKDSNDILSPGIDSLQKSPNVSQIESAESKSELTNSINVPVKQNEVQTDKISDKNLNDSTSSSAELTVKQESSESNGIIADDNAMDTSDMNIDCKSEVNDTVEKCVNVNPGSENKSVNEPVTSIKSDKVEIPENDINKIANTETKVKVENECVKKESVKKEIKKEDNNESPSVKESRTAYDVDLFGMSAPVVLGKRKLDDTKSEKTQSSSKDVKQDNKKESDSSSTKDASKTDQKPSASDKSKSDKDKHSSKDSSKSEKSDSCKEPSSKKQKISKDKKSDSSHKDDKRKSEKKESSHKTTSEKKDEKSKEKEKDKDKHKSKSEKDKKDSDKKSTKEKDPKDDKKKKSEKREKDTKKEEKEKKEVKKEKHDDKKDKHEERKEKAEKKESTDDKKETVEKEKVEEKKGDEKKEKNEEKKEKTDEKKEKIEKKEKEKHDKKEKEKHEKKDGHKHDKHDKHKTPEKRSKSANKDDENKETPKDTPIKDDKSEKKKEHKSSSSSHKSKKSKEEVSSKKSKDDHGEHKKKDESGNRNNKDSPDKSKDTNRKEPGIDKKESNTEKSKDKESTEKCSDQKNKDKGKENKDKDPDVSKSKGKSNIHESSDKSSHGSLDCQQDKIKTDRSCDDKKGEDKKEEKKNKESSSSKSSSSKSSSKDKGKDSQKKSSKSEKSSGKSKSSDSKHESKDKSSEKESKQENTESPEKGGESGLTEEDLAIFAQFSDEPYLSMYDKVKRRSTDRKKKLQKETEEQSKLLCEYKKVSKKKDGKKGLSDITESSDITTDEEKFKRKSNPKAKKKFAFSSDESDSASDSDILKKKQKSKTSTTKPKRILDIYSSDSEEDDVQERMSKTPVKTPNKPKKNEVVKENQQNNFNFDSLSDSDHKTTSTRPAKPKTVAKSNKKTSKSKDTKTSETNGPHTKKNAVNKTAKRKDLSFKDLFSDDSDDSILSDSDSDSDISGIILSPKPKKKVDQKNDKDKKKLPIGSSIYTTSEDSLSDDDTRPPTPITSGHGGKSDGFTSDPDMYHKEPPKSKETTKKNKVLNDSSFIAGLDSIKNKLSNEINEKKLFEKIEKDILASKKAKKQKSKDKSIKEDKKLLNNKKSPESLTEDLHVIKANSKLDIHDLYSETVFEKDNKLFSNLTNKDNVPQILSNNGLDQVLKYQTDSVKKEIVPVQDDSKSAKTQKNKNKKHKKENKKKKKTKDKEEKDSPKDKPDNSQSLPSDVKKDNEKLPDDEEKCEKSENIKPETDSETNGGLNSVTRNLFDDLKEIKSTPSEEKKKKKKKKECSNKDQKASEEQKKFEPKVERLSDSDFFSDSDKKKDTKVQEKHHDETKAEKNSSKKTNKKNDPNADIFDFNEEDDSTFKKIKESHMKIIKPDSYGIEISNDDEDLNSSNVPVEIQGVEIEYQSEDHEIKEDDMFPVVETSEVVIEQSSEEKPDKAKPKPRKRKGRKNSGKEEDHSHLPDLTVEAVSSLEKEHRQAEDIQTEVVQFDAPVSNEQELVIDEGVSLHVEDEASKAVESIVNDENVIDETAKAVESILFGDDMTPFTISEPVEPTPQLDQGYLQPEFAPGLPSGIPHIGNEVETTTVSPVGKGKKGRKGRRSKSGQGDLLLSDNATADNSDTITTKQDTSNKFDYFEDTSYASDISNLHDQNDDDDDGRLQIDFDPPKPEPKQKKQRKPRQPKTKMPDPATALAAENKMPNLFGNFHPEQEQNKDSADINRDSLSSENSELDNAKHDDLLYMNREDQRHDSDMMSPDERSASDDTADNTKTKRRGRKPKNKDVNSMPIPRTNSPRTTRTMSPRSPRNADPRSPKFENYDTKINGAKLPDETLDNKANKLSTNVFDFDETDETNTTAQPAATTKQRKPRRKKGETMQSPDNRGIFSSPDRKVADKLSIASPEPKVPFGSPEHNSQFNIADKKLGIFSPPLQPEEQKLEVQNASVEEKGPPEPLFKAFFEGKSKENQKVNPLLAKKGAGKDKETEGKLNSPPPVLSHSQMMSNIDKTIDDVSKGKFESTDDESKDESPVQAQKKRQMRKSKEDDVKIGMVKSPLKSPLPNHLNSPPPSMSQPLVLPGMGLHGSQMAGPMSPPGVMSKPGQPPVSPSVTNKQTPLQTPLSPAHPNTVFDPLQKMGIQSPKPSLQSPKSAQQSPKGLQQSPKGTAVPQSPFRSQPLLSPTKTSVMSTSAITTVVSSGPVVTTSPSSAVQDMRNPVSTPDGVANPSMPGFMAPGISAGTTVASAGATPSVTSSTTVIPSTMIDAQKKQQQMVSEQLQKQQLEQQRQAEIELQRQQEHHIRLKEEELKQHEMKQKAEFQKQHMLAEQHAKLKEQIQNKEREEMKLLEQKKIIEEQQKKKMLQEHHKMLQQQFEELQRKQALQVAAAVSSGSHVPPGLLSPGALPGPRPSLPSPNEGQGGQRPAISVHHQMPQGPPFVLPGQHQGAVPVRPGSVPPLIAQQMAMRQLVPPLDKPPTSVDLELTHQQLQQHIAAQQAQQKAQVQAQQKAQAQALAEQQAQMAKHEAQQAQAHAKQIAQSKTSQPVIQQSQGKQQAQQKKPAETAKSVPQSPANNRKDMLLQRPPLHGVGIPPQGKDAPLPGSQEAANQLTQQIKQQLAMSQANPPTGHAPQQHPLHGWPMAHGIRPEGPRQPGSMPVTSEARISMPGPVPVLGGNPQQVQRVSPHPPTKSPTVAQTAPNMVHGFSQNQAATPRAPSPAVAKTAERPGQGGGKWSASPGSQRPGQPDVRPRVPSSDAGTVRPELWSGMNGPANPAPHSIPGAPRPAHQQPPSAHRQPIDHVHLGQGHGEMSTKDKFIHQQREKQIQEFQRQQELMEMQRHHLREQALQAKAQKEVQLHKERERAESLEQEKRDRDSRSGQSGLNTIEPHSNIVKMGYPFAEPRPPSRDGKMPPQSPALVDPRDPRFTPQFPGHHPTDLRIGSATSSAFSPASGTPDPHIISNAELQRFQQNGMIPPGYGLRMLEHNLIGGPGPGPYMIPGLPLSYMAAQQMDQAHVIDGRPPSRSGSGRPPSTQSIHTLSPTQAPGGDGRNQNRPGQPGQVAQTRDPHPGDGSLLNLLQRYPVMWQGVLGLKNDQCVVQMHFISGFQPLVKLSLPQQEPDGTVQPLRIAQRMRLEQTQLEGVGKRMQMEKDYCMMLALPCGRDTSDIYQQTKAMSSGFIQYLQQKQAAGIVNVADPGSQQPAYVVHIFPPCEFSQTTLSRLGFDLLYQVKDLAHLIVIIATVA